MTKERSGLRTGAGILALTALVAACGPTLQQTRGRDQTAPTKHELQLRQQALENLRKQDVSVDDAVRCNDPRSNWGYEASFLDSEARGAALEKYFASKGEAVTNSYQINARHLVLTDQGNVYEIGHMKVFSAPSDRAEMFCAQAYAPTVVRKTDMTPAQYNAFVEKSQKKWDDDQQRRDDAWDRRMEESDRRWDERMRRSDERWNDRMKGFGDLGNFEGPGQKCTTTTTTDQYGSTKTETKCVERR